MNDDYFWIKDQSLLNFTYYYYKVSTLLLGTFEDLTFSDVNYTLMYNRILFNVYTVTNL